MLTNLPVPYDLCVGIPISHILSIVSLIAFNQEKAQVGAFSMIAKPREGSFPAPAAANFARCQVGGSWPRLGFTRGMPAPAAARTANIKRAWQPPHRALKLLGSDASF